MKEKEEKLEIIEENEYNDDDFKCLIKNIIPVLEIFNRNVMDSSLSIPVAKMFTYIDEVDINKESVYEKILYIRRLFEKNKWTSSGFSSPPDRKSIIEGLNKFFINMET